MSSPSSPPYENRCDKTAWYSNLMYISCTLLAQVMLTLRFGTVLFGGSEMIQCECCRIYAVTLKHIPTAVGFAVIATLQFTFGIYIFVLTVRGGGKVGLSDKKSPFMEPNRLAATILL